MSIPSILTEATPASQRRSIGSKKRDHVDASHVLHELEQHILLDGFKIVIELEKSRGSYLYDAATGHRLIDLYGFFGSLTVGFNHPHFDQPEVKADLSRAPNAQIA